MVDRILRGLTYEESRNGGEDGGGDGGGGGGGDGMVGKDGRVAGYLSRICARRRRFKCAGWGRCA